MACTMPEGGLELSRLPCFRKLRTLLTQGTHRTHKTHALHTLGTHTLNLAERWQRAGISTQQNRPSHGQPRTWFTPLRVRNLRKAP
jgi:hypothetical protein